MLRQPLRSLAATVTTILLASSLGAGSAMAAPNPAPDSTGPPIADAAQPGKGDSDGDKIADDLEAALADLKPGDRVDVIVQGTTPGQARRAAPSLTLDHLYRIIPAFSGSVVAGQVEALAQIPWVTRVELDGISVAFDAAGDRDYGVQAARDASLHDDEALDGDGVGICVIDTGIDPNHEQLQGRVVGWIDYVNGRSSAYDDNGHGTHVSGIAAGDGTGSHANADEYGGVARSALLVGAKVLNSSGSGSDSNVAAAIDWCAQRSDVRILSLSLGSPGGDGSDAASQAVDSAVTNYGKVVVVAAGNSGDAPGTVGSPGVATHAVTVGAATDYSVPTGAPGHDDGLVLAGFSSRGPTANEQAPLKPDVVAAGVTVVAAQAGTTSSYAVYSGTSMATPFVSGVVALGLELVPTATPVQVRDALHAAAMDAGPAGPDNDWGHGLVDARAFVDVLRGQSPAQPTAWPTHQLLEGSVGSSSTTDIPLEVSTPGQPLGVSMRIDGSMQCALGFLWICLAYEWSPDLDVYLIDPGGQQVAASRCPLEGGNGYCGSAGRWETLGVASAAAGTWTLRVVPFAESPNNGKGGTFELDVFGATGQVVNQPPTADAGDDLSVETGTVVTLDGSGSSDPDGDALSYAWAFTSRPDGSSATLSGATTASPSFTPDEVGGYVIELTVIDGNGGAATDSVTVTATEATVNQPPTADAGDDLSVETGTVATLDGSGSSDPDGDALSYVWVFTSRPDGSSATLSGATTPSPSFTPDEVGSYVIELTVTDGKGGSATDSVTVAATDPAVSNQPPEADAGTDVAVTARKWGHFTLDGTGSSDPDGDPLTYEWSLDGAVVGTTETLRQKQSAGTYTYTLTVTDPHGASDSDSVTVTVT